MKAQRYVLSAWSEVMQESLKQNRNYLMLWGFVALGFAVCYFSTFRWLIYKYEGFDSYYSHGYLIPFVSIYLIYLKRKEISQVDVSSTPAGLCLIVFALAVHVFGVLGNIHFISGFSMVLYIIGCSLYLKGQQITRMILLPLFFLVFMCPIPEAYINIIAIPFKSLATSIALQFLDILNIPYTREGFLIHLPSSSFLVGTPCNGMRSLIAFTALGVLMLYLFRTSLWKKVIFLAVIPPLALLLNGIRIFLLLWIANRYGQEAASPESYLHDGSGMLVFIIGFIAMVLLVKRINEQPKN
jgi:exosortase